MAEKIIPQIEYFNENPWATVSTLDGTESVSVSLSNLHYDEIDGRVYLLAGTGQGDEYRELRLYLKPEITD